MIKNVIFDMGNVLLDFNVNSILDAFCHSQEEKNIFLRELFQSPYWLMADRGVILDSERYDYVKKNVPEQYHKDLKECCEHWWSIRMGALPGALDFIQNCKRAGYKIYILSNASDKFQTYFPLFLPLDYFDGAVISYQEKLLKPEKEIYEVLLKRYNLIAEECYFIDDREENIAAAKALGFDGHVFKDDYDVLNTIFGFEA